MVPTAFDEDNCTISLNGPNKTDMEIPPISAWYGTMENGEEVLVTCWKATKEELEEINRTGRIWVMILGSVTPPIHVTASKPI